jgi:hypothetical protein
MILQFPDGALPPVWAVRPGLAPNIEPPPVFSVSQGSARIGGQENGGAQALSQIGPLSYAKVWVDGQIS